MKVFLSDLCLRPSCFDCHSKSLHRKSDITLSDFWGIDNIDKSMNDNKGTSLVFVNSVKGGEIFDAVKENVVYKETDLSEAVKYNTAAYKSCAKPKSRDLFMQEIMNNDFFDTVNKYTKISFYRRCRGIAGRILRIGKRKKCS